MLLISQKLELEIVDKPIKKFPDIFNFLKFHQAFWNL